MKNDNKVNLQNMLVEYINSKTDENFAFEYFKRALNCLSAGFKDKIHYAGDLEWIINNSENFIEYAEGLGFNEDDSIKAGFFIPYVVITQYFNNVEKNDAQICTRDMCDKYLTKRLNCSSDLSKKDCEIICLKLYREYKDLPWTDLGGANITLKDAKNYTSQYPEYFGSQAKEEFHIYYEYLDRVIKFCKDKIEAGWGNTFNGKSFPDEIPGISLN